MFDKCMDFIAAAICTIVAALLLWILASLAYSLHKEFVSNSQSNQPAKIEARK